MPADPALVGRLSAPAAGSAAPRLVVRRRVPPQRAAVRETVTGIEEALRSHGATAAGAGLAALVMAEVLNNVLDHACAGGPAEGIDLDCVLGGTVLSVVLTDRGRPMKGLRAPVGGPPNLAVARCDLPERGFGWFLIRTLARDIAYARLDDANRLSFALDLATLA